MLYKVYFSPITYVRIFVVWSIVALTNVRVCSQESRGNLRVWLRGLICYLYQIKLDKLNLTGEF